MVVLSERLWRTRFNGDPNIVGKGVVLSGESFTVIGVMPAGIQHVGGDFHTPAHGETVDLWWPLALLPHDAAGCDRGCHYLNMVARLAPGVSAAQAAAAMNSVSAQLAKEHPDNAHQISVVPLKEEIVGAGAADAFRAAGRRGISAADRLRECGEFVAGASDHAAAGIRAAFHAGRWEFPDFAAAADGKFAAGVFGLRAGIAVRDLGRGCADRAGAGTIAAAAGGAHGCAGAGVRCADHRADVRDIRFGSGFGDAADGRQPDLEGWRSRDDTGIGAQRFRNALVIVETCLALVLLAGAGLLMRTFINLQHVSAGFQPEHVLTLRTDLPSKRYPDDAASIRFYKNLVERLKALPGVQSAGISSDIPWTGYDENSNFDIEGRPESPNDSPEARYHFATPGYFETIGTPLLSGRSFALTDDEKAPKVVMINAALARRYFPGEDPVGKMLDLFGTKGVKIIGIVGDVKDSPDGAEAKPAFYLNDWQVTFRDTRVIVLRSNSNLAPLVEAVRAEIAALDKDLPVTDIKPMEEIGAHAVSSTRFTSLLIGCFAALALVLACVGIFGVMAYSVTQRTHEFGIRMALGAQQRDVLGMVLAQGARLLFAGLVLGWIAAFPYAGDGWLVVRSARRRSVDVRSGLRVAGGVTIAACILPALRATKVDPIDALRYE